MTDKNDALFLVSLPFGQKTIPYGEVSARIATAKSPGYDCENATDHEGVMFALGVMQEEGQLKAAVRAGEVEVLNKSFYRISPHASGVQLENALLTVQAFREYLASIHGFVEVEVSPEPQQTALATDAAQPAPEVELDYSLLATPTELLDAFEKWGLRAAWFAELDSHKWLLEAQRKKGQGQRGNVIQPLFCPFAVINGLIGKVRKANRLQPDTAWRTLEHKFPKVHATFESHDPRERTGD